jgi:flavocytochrome c
MHALAPRVVVIGGGLAGLAAALSAADAGARVTLLDAAAHVPSGASLCASSGLSAARDEADVPRFAADLAASAGSRPAPLASALAAGSLRARDWLAAHGAPPLSRCVLTGGHSVARTWLPSLSSNGDAPAVGAALSHALAAAARARPAITLRAHARAAALVLRAGAVVGVRLEEAGEEIAADGVVLATGGYGASPALLPRALASAPWSAAPTAEGSGVGLATAAGAALVDMDAVQLHPTAFTSTLDAWGGGTRPHLFIAAEALRGVGGVLLDTQTGERFSNELTRRDALTALLLARADRAAVLVVPARAAAGAPGAAFHERAGRLTRVAGAGGLAAWWPRAPPPQLAALAAALGAVRAVAARGGRDEFGRADWGAPGAWAGDELLVGLVAPATHYTLGGVCVDAEGAALDAAGARVRGLFAAGEVTGGVHGGNRLAGAALAETIVFGVAAGAAAARGGA